MTDLIISVSGLRGIVGTGLTDRVARDYAAAFATSLGGGRVIVARDSRPSGQRIIDAVVAGLTAGGCEPIVAGLAATPTCGVLVGEWAAAGGIEVSASHNPPHWNGIKLFHATGRVLNEREGWQVQSVFTSRAFRTDGPARPNVTQIPHPHAAHLSRVLAAVDVAAIRARRFRVVLDSNHGVGGILGQQLLDVLGCDLRVLGADPDGAFQHPPEPIPQHLTALGQAVCDHAAHVGFAQDPDADRLALVDESGRAIGEELTITLVADHVLARKPGVVVVNLSTTRAVDDVAAARGSTCQRSAVGEANVVDRMLERRAVLGGEGNGGVIVPEVVYVRDSFGGMALVLDALAATGESIADKVARLPQYVMVKQTIQLPADSLRRALERLPGHFPDATPNHRDGLRLDWPDRWLHIRPSNTEPIARIIAEAGSETTAMSLVDAARRALIE